MDKNKDISDKIVQNLRLLKKRCYDVKFDLDNSNYTPVENIGSGAYGVVCSAIHKSTKDKVAIKKIPSIFDHKEIAKRTYREVKILKHFKHDNIISIREILRPQGDDFRDIYIVLDFMESDLHQIIHSQQVLTEEHVRFFLYQILRGLKYIHSANVIHRDLKPSNLLVNENCELKIGDFGMARGVESCPQVSNAFMTQYVSTRWYRAPEIMLCMIEYSAAVDLWSVGCIFAEMLGRKQLFPGRTYHHQLKLIVDIRGTPDSDYVELLKSEQFQNMVKEWKPKNAVKLQDLYPKLSQDGVELLDLMLQLDPRKRVTVETALKHPYLKKYHDADDEPICIPVFNFDFEKTNPSSDDLKKAITKEILDYSKPAPILNMANLNLKPVSREEMKKPVNVVKPTVRSTLIPTSQPTKSQPAAMGLAAFLEQQKKTTTSILKPQHQRPIAPKFDFQVVPDISTIPNLKPATYGVTAVVDTKENGGDVEMLSAKSFKGEADGGLQVKTELTDAAADVEMHSANSHSAVKDEVKEEKKLDPKALLKEAILKAGLRRQQQGEHQGKKKPVTAHQRQKEREAKRKKRDLAKERRKKGVQELAAIPNVLSEDDKTLLERWQSMQKQVKPSVPSAVPSTSGTLATIEGFQLTVSSVSPEQRLIPAVVPQYRSDQPTASQAVPGQPHLTPPQGWQEIHGAQSQAQPNMTPPQDQPTATVIALQPHAPANMTPLLGLHTPSVGSLIAQPTPLMNLSQAQTNLHTSPQQAQADSLLTQQQGLSNPHMSPQQGQPALHVSPSQGQPLPHGSTQQGQPASQGQPTPHVSTSLSQPAQPGQSDLQMRSQGGHTNAHIISPPYLVDASSVDLARMASKQSLFSPNKAASEAKPACVAAEEASGSSSQSPSHAAPQSHDKLPEGVTPIAITTPRQTVPRTLNESLELLLQHSNLPSYNEAIKAKVTAILQASQGNTGETPAALLPSNRAHIESMVTDSPKPSTSTMAGVLENRGNPMLTTAIPAGDPAISPSLGLDWLQALSKQMSKSHVDDLTLAQTPKGTGGGYGVGVDFDAIVEEMLMETKEDIQSGRQDSAPLSASLIADWRELRGNMNGEDLEALQHEIIELGSPLLFSELTS